MIISNFKDFSQLNEARFEDTYSPAFVEFVSRYKKLIESGKLKRPEKYYVQFTNLKDNRLDKSIHQSPDHADPVGIYGYPLEYVLNHPSDIWYGASAQNLRVLKDKTKTGEKLILSNIHTRLTLTKALDNIGMDRDDQKRLIKMAQYEYANRFKGVNQFGKLFMTLLQMDMDGERDTNRRFKVLTGTEQSKRLLQSYLAIEDRSRSIEDAIINDREPEQICFLSRKAFDVVEVVVLHRNQKNGTNLVVQKPQARKLASLLAQQVLGDKLLTPAIEKSFGSDGMYWTAKGRRIEVAFNTKSEYIEDLGMGQKHHRYGTHIDQHELRGHIYTEWGSIMLLNEDEATYAEIIADAKEEFEWLVGKGQKTDWQPENKAEYERKLKEKQDAEFAKQHEENKKKYNSEYLELISILGKWADKLDWMEKHRKIYMPLSDTEFTAEVGHNVALILSKIEEKRIKPHDAADFEDAVRLNLDPFEDADSYFSKQKGNFIRDTIALLIEINQEYPKVFANAFEAQMRFRTLRTN